MNSYTGKKLVAKLGLALALFVSPCPSLTAASVNLLPNADFNTRSATPNAPDSWGVTWPGLGLYITSWTNDGISIDNNTSSPISGTGVLRLHYPSIDRIHIPQAWGYRDGCMSILIGHSPLEEGSTTNNNKFTLSVYAKASHDNTPIYFKAPGSPIKVKFLVGKEWKRLSYTGTTDESIDKMGFFFGSPSDPAECRDLYDTYIWLTAPQLETGDLATAFSSAAASPTPIPHVSNYATPTPPPPSYRLQTELNYYTTESSARFRIHNLPSAVTSIQVKILDTTGHQTGPILLVVPDPRPTQPRTPTPVTCELPINSLPVGSYRIEANTGSSQPVVSADLIKLPPSGTEVKCNRFYRTQQINGRSIFPVFLPTPLVGLNEHALSLLKSGGFNALAGALGVDLSIADILDHGLTPAQTAQIKRLLDQLQLHGFRYYWSLSWDLRDWRQQKSIVNGNIKKYADVYIKIISTFKDHPAIAGWYIIDEATKESWAEPFGYMESDLVVLHDLVHAADPYRPVFTNTWAGSPRSTSDNNAAYGGFSASDMIWEDNYWTVQAGLDLEKIARWVQKTNSGNAINYPQFEWISGSYGPPLVTSAARPAAIRAHAWLQFVYGTRGIGYWEGIPAIPEAWAEMRRFNDEARNLTEGPLSAPDAIIVASGTANTRIHYSIWLSGGSAYVLAVSTAEQATQFQLDLKNLLKGTILSAQRYFEQTPVAVASGTLADTIAPLQRAVYKVQLK